MLLNSLANANARDLFKIYVCPSYFMYLVMQITDFVSSGSCFVQKNLSAPFESNLATHFQVEVEV